MALALVGIVMVTYVTTITIPSPREDAYRRAHFTVHAEDQAAAETCSRVLHEVVRRQVQEAD